MSTKSLGQSLYEFTKVFEHLAAQAEERGDEGFLKICSIICDNGIKNDDLVVIKVKPKKLSKKRED